MKQIKMLALKTEEPTVVCPIIIDSTFQGIKTESVRFIDERLNHPNNYDYREVAECIRMHDLIKSGVAVVATKENVVIYHYTESWTPGLIEEIPRTLYRKFFTSCGATTEECIPFPMFEIMKFNMPDSPIEVMKVEDAIARMKGKKKLNIEDIINRR
jgi:hypothetical protein